MNAFPFRLFLTVFFLTVFVFPTSSHADITTGLKCWWKFEEGANTTVADSSGNGNGGTFHGGVNWIAGKIDLKAVSLDGSSGYIDGGLMPDIDNVSAFTMSFWVNPTVLSNGKFLFFRQTGDGQSRIGFMDNGNGSANFYLANGADSYSQTTAFLTVGTWTHFIAVYDGSQPTNATRIKIFVNGVQQTLNFFAAAVPATSGTLPGNFLLGQQYGAYVNFQVDEFRVYNRALSASDVSQLYAYGLPAHIVFRGVTHINNMKIKAP